MVICFMLTWLVNYYAAEIGMGISLSSSEKTSQTVKIIDEFKRMLSNIETE